MNRGKEICRELKAVRRSIAEENGIPLEIPECPHKGPCPGTCPRCEQELRQLESALAQRISVGKVATVAGVALALASPAVAQTGDTLPQVPPQHVRQSKICHLSGAVVDDSTGKPLPFVEVLIRRDMGDTAQVKVTDMDGHFSAVLFAGHYHIEARMIGYDKNINEVDLAPCTVQMDTIRMKDDPAISRRLEEFTIVETRLPGVISVDTPAVADQPQPLVVLQPAKPVKVRGTIVDEETKEPLPFVRVGFFDGEQRVLCAETDFDGEFKCELVPGAYMMEIRYVGYYKEERMVTVDNKTNLGAIALRASAQLLDGIVIMEDPNPLLEIGPNGHSQSMEIEGVRVIVK